MKRPNFFVIGAGRCGTTSLHDALSQHPQVFVSVEKSPNYFVPHDKIPERENALLRQMMAEWVTNWDTYQRLFTALAHQRAIGEVSPVYLQNLSSAGLIQAKCPEAKIIAILRQPSERAYAHFYGRRRDGLEPRRSFDATVDEQLREGVPHDLAYGHYIGCGRYAHFLQPYFDHFPCSNIRVFLYDELLSNPTKLLRELFQFLSVDQDVHVSFKHLGKTGELMSPTLAALWTGSAAMRTRLRAYLPRQIRDLGMRVLSSKTHKPEMNPETRRLLDDFFAPDIEQLEHLINRDLSHWRS